MSAYDDAVAYLDAEVHPRCDYDIYSDMRDIVDEMEEDNAKLRKLAGGMYGMLATFDAILGSHDACETPRPLIFGENKSFKDVMRMVGIEVKP